MRSHSSRGGAHDVQTDKLSIPHTHHVADVARRVSDQSEHIRCIAWLHDIVEDTPVVLEDVEAEFGSDVRDGVDAMTRRDGEGYFAEYLPRLMRTPRAVPVKIADSTHNFGKIHLLRAVDPDRAVSLQAKYHRVLNKLGATIPAEPNIVFDGEHWVAA